MRRQTRSRKRSKRHNTRKTTQRKRRFFRKAGGGINDKVVVGPMGVMSNADYQQAMENLEQQGPE